MNDDAYHVRCYVLLLLSERSRYTLYTYSPHIPILSHLLLLPPLTTEVIFKTLSNTASHEKQPGKKTHSLPQSTHTASSSSWPPK